MPTTNPVSGNQVVSPTLVRSRATTQRLISPGFTPSELALVLDALDASIATSKEHTIEVERLRPGSIALDICQAYTAATVALRRRLSYFGR